MSTKANLARVLYEEQDHVFTWDEVTILYHYWPRLLLDEPDCFLLARPVIWADQAGIAAEKSFRVADCDTWFIWLYAGEIRHLHRLMPFSLPHVAYRRMDGSLHFYPFDRLKRLVNPQQGRNTLPYGQNGSQFFRSA